MQTADQAHNTNSISAATRIAAAAMAAHDDYMKAGEQHFASRAPAPEDADTAMGAALRLHSMFSADLARVSAPDIAGMRAKAAVMLSTMTLSPGGLPAPSAGKDIELAYSLARDILGDEFQAALDRVAPPHHDPARTPAAA